MKSKHLVLCALLCSAFANPASADNDLIKCQLVDTSDGSKDTPTFEMMTDVRDGTAPGKLAVPIGPRLFERTREIIEPHRWYGNEYVYARNDDLGIVAASDYDWGNQKQFEGSAFFYFDKRTGKAQLIELMGADKKPDVETGTCQIVPQ